MNLITVDSPNDSTEQYWRFIVASNNATDTNGPLYYINSFDHNFHKLAVGNVESEKRWLHIDLGRWYFREGQGDDKMMASIKNQ